MRNGRVNGDAIAHRQIQVNGVTLHIAEQGQGPLVLLLHGFPESWYSWRHQFAPLAEAGYHVVAPDQRGYAGSEQPEDVDAYTLLHLVGDVTGLISALGHDRAVLVGHDWGAPIAWVTAMLRPDLIRGVAGLSVPPILPAGMIGQTWTRQIYGDGFYQVYFQTPGRADAELASDIQSFLRGMLFGASGDNPAMANPEPWIVPDGDTLLDTVPPPASLPDWLTEADIEAYTRDHSQHGANAFTGGLNWYRNLERNHELLFPFTGRRIEVPALFMIGDRDMVTSLHGVREIRATLKHSVPQLHDDITLAGCGHWTQQERPEEVNAALLNFLAAIDAPPQAALEQ